MSLTRPVSPRHAAFALVGDATGSSRALRQIRALTDDGWSVSLLQTAPPREAGALPHRVDLAVAEVEGAGPRMFWRAHRTLTRAIAEIEADLYLASDLYALPALARAARQRGAALVYDSRELYAALDSSHGRPWVSTVWSAVERRFIHQADAMLTVGDAIADRLEARYRIDRPTVLYNAPEPLPSPDRTALRRELSLPDDGRMVVLYQGLFREGRGLHALTEAAGVVDGVRLVMIGEGALRGDLEAAREKLGDRLVLHPFVPPDRLARLTPGADLGACLIEPLTESLRLSLPNKLFEYLAAGVPVLASPLPEIARVVDRGVGALADPSDPAAVADALRRSLDPARRSEWHDRCASALAPYTWTRGRAAFLDLLNRLA